jgi:hypothetical protein
MMKMTRIGMASMLAACLMIPVSHAGELQPYKGKYDTALEAIILEHGMRVADLNKEYRKALDSLVTKVKKQGDLDRTKAILAELERFAQEKAVPAERSLDVYLKSIQGTYASRSVELRTDMAKSILTLTGQYDAALSRLQKKLTSSDDLNGATAVQTERQRVAKTDAVVSAKEQILRATTVATDSKKAVPAAAINPTIRECTIRWSCADCADVYVNGQPVGDYTTDFKFRPDAARRTFVEKRNLTRGDVLTVGARRGGSFGFILIVLDEEDRIIWQTDEKHWRSYSPKDKKQWYLPSVATKSGTTRVSVQPNPYGPQNPIQAASEGAAVPIWHRETNEQHAYFISTLP